MEMIIKDPGYLKEPRGNGLEETLQGELPVHPRGVPRAVLIG